MKLLSELEKVMALLGLATPGEFSVRRGDVVDADGVPVMITDYEGDNAAAFAASINFLRQHGPAIAAALRAVEGDALDAARYRWLRDEAWAHHETAPACSLVDARGTELKSLDGVRLDHFIDQARVIPLDAAGSAEGVS